MRRKVRRNLVSQSFFPFLFLWMVNTIAAGNATTVNKDMLRRILAKAPS